MKKVFFFDLVVIHSFSLTVLAESSSHSWGTVTFEGGHTTSPVLAARMAKSQKKQTVEQDLLTIQFSMPHKVKLQAILFVFSEGQTCIQKSFQLLSKFKGNSDFRHTYILTVRNISIKARNFEFSLTTFTMERRGKRPPNGKCINYFFSSSPSVLQVA